MAAENYTIEGVQLLRIGIIGAGGAARSIHWPGLRVCPQVEIMAVCDPDLAAARSLGVSRVFERADPWALRVALGPEAADPSCPLIRHDVPEEFLKIPGSPRDVRADDPRRGYRYDQAWQFVESVRQGASSETRSWARVAG